MLKISGQSGLLASLVAEADLEAAPLAATVHKDNTLVLLRVKLEHMHVLVIRAVFHLELLVQGPNYQLVNGLQRRKYLCCLQNVKNLAVI